VLVDSPQRYTGSGRYKIFIGSWNVNGVVPEESIHDWLRLEERYDIYMFSLQEVVPLKAKSMFIRETSNNLMQWELLWKLKLGPDYEIIYTNQLFGLSLTIFAHRSHLPHICDIQSQTTSCGFMGVVSSVALLPSPYHIFARQTRARSLPA